MVRPRAAVIDRQDRLFIVDFTARIQAFDLDGKYLGLTWTTPDYRNGRPSGLGIDRDGNIIVSDSHYHCFRIYNAQGKELRRFGGESGTAPGQFGYVSDVVQDADGFYYVAEFGEVQRITKLDIDGKFICCWGGEGGEPGQFARVRALALGPDGLLYAADACNHRIQVFTRDGKLVRCWGHSGTGPGELRYPYDLAFNARRRSLRRGVRATAGCRSSLPRDSRSAAGAVLDGRNPVAFTLPGPWPSIGMAGFTSWIQKTTASSGSPSETDGPDAMNLPLTLPLAAAPLPPWLVGRWPAALIVVLAVVVFLAAAFLRRRRPVAAACLAFAGCGFFLFAAGGLGVPAKYAFWLLVRRIVSLRPPGRRPPLARRLVASSGPAAARRWPGRPGRSRPP